MSDAVPKLNEAIVSLNNEEQFVEPLLKVCLNCGTVSEKMDKCLICKQKYKAKSYYCSKNCQRKDWPAHRLLHSMKDKTMAKEAGTRDRRVAEAEKSAEISNPESEDRIRKATISLFAAAFVGDVDEIRNLIRSNASPDAKCDQGLSALQYAIYRGHTNAVEVLCAESARMLFETPVQWKGATCLHLAAALGREKVVELLLKIGGMPLISKPDNQGCSCLFPACHEGHLEIVKVGR